ncbi:hypothetical protein Phep_0879 [Pedobacter heparinus DSM 2366]|uniref:Uncharacterized protein n=1 Tax=Pedobacter heparinus (strain ATCC 13125 / DSM 2366 / CIP 104194 / JCM 7457 / NBRC 12017 / NCIMB 9290 / NRRL B-14731 / HIM 762-3) TaxID=485917 RepID=C6Y2A8_PEDHD|nr:hypothetical protein Phep_0879 [Pedobacter heparinus DSM 2366]
MRGKRDNMRGFYNLAYGKYLFDIADEKAAPKRYF